MMICAFISGFLPTAVSADGQRMVIGMFKLSPALVGKSGDAQM
jgi:hypothetical protein